MDARLPQMSRAKTMTHSRYQIKLTGLPIVALTTLAIVGDRNCNLAANAASFADGCGKLNSAGGCHLALSALKKHNRNP